MADFTVEAQVREELGKRNEDLRDEGLMPAVIYGGKNNLNIKLERRKFDKLVEQAGESNIIDLVVDGKNIPVLIKDYQEHPVTGEFLHADFYEIDMKKELHAMVDINFMGVPPAVKTLGGVLIKKTDQVEIQCLPGNLIHSVDVDLSILDDFDKTIHVSDLSVPENVKIVTSGEVLIAKVDEPKKEEETVETEAPEQELPEGVEEKAEAEGEGQGKKEGEEKSEE